MPDRYQHIRFSRAEPVNLRRSRRGRGVPPPSDPRAHARALVRSLDAHRQPLPSEVAGFDPRRLLKLTVEQLDPGELERIPGLSVVAQEDKKITVLFASDAGLGEFH